MPDKTSAKKATAKKAAPAKKTAARKAAAPKKAAAAKPKAMTGAVTPPAQQPAVKRQGLIARLFKRG